MKNIEIETETQFYIDLQKNFRMNDGYMSRGLYNLIVTIRDVKLYCNINMKPHRFWKITDVKKYFGIKGNKEKILEQLEQMFEILKNEKNDSV